MEAALSFKSLSSQKYLLKISSKMNLGGFTSNNEVEIRWLLSLREIGMDYYRFELITLDHAMTKTDNSGYIEVHKLVSQMQKALNEIKFTIDKQGNLIKVDNLEQIKSRWETVKSEVIEYNRSNTSLVDLFKLQDEIFESKGGVEGMVRATEFFDVYLNQIYGRSFFSRIKRNIPNLFRSGNIPFALKYEGEKSTKKENTYEIQIEGYPNILSETHVKDVYGGFPFIDADIVKPIYTYTARYSINDISGFVKEARITFTEFVNDQLSGEVNYEIQQYE